MGDIRLENYIGGEFVSSTDGRLLDSEDPSTGAPLLQLPDSGPDDVTAAVAAAAAAFPDWSQRPVLERAGFCYRVAAAIESRLDEFARAESRDQGKPVWLARSVDIPRAVLNLRAFAESMSHELQPCNTPASGLLNYTLRQPVGVVAIVAPWNLPLYLLTFKIAPAIVAGNTVVCKPSEFTSHTAYLLARLLQQEGLPAGVVNMVFGTGARAGEPLVTHPDVRLVSFTGSTAVGRRISQLCATSFKRVSLELGGKNAAVVFADADLSDAVATLVRAAFINSGQVCLCTSRIFVQQAVYDQFVQLFVQTTRSKRVGPPDQPDVFMGPLNNRGQYDKVRQYLQLAVAEGGRIACGETLDPPLQLPAPYSGGYYLQPTVLTGLQDAARCMQEEIFGPVVCIVPFDTLDEAVERVNCTQYGLCASVWTRDLGRAHSIAERLHVGTVWTNCWLVRSLDMPFGGVKCSGFGSESTRESLEFYTQWKTICVKFN